MPVPDRDIGLFAQVIETDELIIDECLEGANVEGISKSVDNLLLI